jgi:hypothetical protein
MNYLSGAAIIKKILVKIMIYPVAKSTIIWFKQKL